MRLIRAHATAAPWDSAAVAAVDLVVESRASVGYEFFAPVAAQGSGTSAAPFRDDLPPPAGSMLERILHAHRQPRAASVRAVAGAAIEADSGAHVSPSGEVTLLERRLVDELLFGLRAADGLPPGSAVRRGPRGAWFAVETTDAGVRWLIGDSRVGAIEGCFDPPLAPPPR